MKYIKEGNKDSKPDKGELWDAVAIASELCSKNLFHNQLFSWLFIKIYKETTNVDI